MITMLFALACGIMAVINMVAFVWFSGDWGNLVVALLNAFMTGLLGFIAYNETCS
jgi:hypothetical protein